MSPERVAVQLWRTVHLLSICAWIGGGIGIMLLLSLDCQARNGSELQAYNRVIDAVDDWIIAPGAISTLVSGLLLARARHFAVLASPFLRLKLLVTATAIVYGLWFVAPCLERLLTRSILADLAVFDDHSYAASFTTASIRCTLQALLVLGLLVVSVIGPRIAALLPGNRHLIPGRAGK
jgi:uncharacterized membrane protein